MVSGLLRCFEVAFSNVAEELGPADNVASDSLTFNASVLDELAAP